MKKILLIKHGSLGDIVFSLPVMYSIRHHFSNDKIDLLTEEKYVSLLDHSKYFNKIITDNRYKNIFKTLNLLMNLRKNKYDLIIDLQNSTRTSLYNFFFRFFDNCLISSSRIFSHYRYLIPLQGKETTTEGLFNQINLLKINKNNNEEYFWLQRKLDIEYDSKLVLFIPGVSSKGKYKQWQPKKFAEIAKYCEMKKYKICVVGTNNDRDSVAPIFLNCKNVIDNIDNSPPDKIFSIAKKSSLVITNDTGPGHIAALTKTKILWILNDNKITASNVPNNENNLKILSDNLKNISVDKVIDFIQKENLL